MHLKTKSSIFSNNELDSKVILEKKDASNSEFSIFKVKNYYQEEN